MEAASNSSLLQYRLGAELMSEATAEELGAEVLALCGRCELYGRSCAQQAFLWVNVERFLARGQERLGHEVSTEGLPRTLRLDPARIRKSIRPVPPPASLRPLRVSSIAPKASVA